MGDDPHVPELLSQESPQTHITINQFVQLINKHESLFDAEALNKFRPEDKEWIKRRAEIEQEDRHRLTEKFMDQQHDWRMKYFVIRQITTGTILVIAILGSMLLLYLGLGLYAILLLAVVMCPPVAAGIAQQIVKHFSKNQEP